MKETKSEIFLVDLFCNSNQAFPGKQTADFENVRDFDSVNCYGLANEIMSNKEFAMTKL